MTDTRKQAAAIPFRVTELGSTEVLLVSLSGGGWGFPKGGVKKGSSPESTARLESLEEAGVLGEIVAPPLGKYVYRKQGKKQVVSVFPLRVTRMLDRWQEEHERIRIWIPIAEAHALLRRGTKIERFLTLLQHRLLAESCVLLRRVA